MRLRLPRSLGSRHSCGPHRGIAFGLACLYPFLVTLASFSCVLPVSLRVLSIKGPIVGIPFGAVFLQVPAAVDGPFAGEAASHQTPIGRLSLNGVFGSEFVPTLAVSKPLPFVCFMRNPSPYILITGNHLQVKGVHASAVSAKVVDLHPWGNVGVCDNHVRGAIGVFALPFVLGHPCVSARYCFAPFPASGGSHIAALEDLKDAPVYSSGPICYCTHDGKYRTPTNTAL